MSPATDGFSAMINAFPITLTGWIYEPRKNRRKTSFSNQGTSRKFALKSKPEKFYADARARPDTRTALSRAGRIQDHGRAPVGARRGFGLGGHVRFSCALGRARATVSTRTLGSSKT